MTSPILQLQGCLKRFGGLTAIKDVSLELAPGGLYGLIGPNGAGKTTLFNLITGVYRPDGGSIRMGATRLDGLPPHVIAAAGVSRTFQNIRLFGNLTVLENVAISFHMHKRQNLLDALLRTRRFREEERAIESRSLELLDIFKLRKQAKEKASSLPYGSQRRLEIVRALATSPKVLLLDEPAAGMNPQESQELMRLIRRLRDEFSLSVLLVEHNMKVVMGVCETVQVIDHGESIAVGTPDEVRKDSRVIEAYLGPQ